MTIAAASVIEVPQDMALHRIALTEPAATALHAMNLAARALARPLPEARVLVIGGGAVGLLTALLHIGLTDWASEIDMRRLTLAEITLIGSYTYCTADLRATVQALHAGVFGDLSWVDMRPLAEGAAAFADLDQGRCASGKIVLQPQTLAGEPS